MTARAIEDRTSLGFALSRAAEFLDWDDEDGGDDGEDEWFWDLFWGEV